MIGVYWRTARFYLPAQIAARLNYSVEAALRKRFPQFGLRRYKIPAGLVRDEHAVFFPVHDGGYELNREAEDAARMRDGVFRFLNSERYLGIPPDWDPAGTTRLWRYNLHYFEYAVDLALLAGWRNDGAAAELLDRLCADWIRSNPVGAGVAWHSYPIARRIVSWIQAFSLASPGRIFRNPASESLWIGSLHQQARYLADHLEFDLLGNHLLADGKALVFAGLFFGGAEGTRWFEAGRSILWDGVRDQIHPDGGHEERSPMYQAIVLQDYLEVILAHQLNGKQIPDWVRERLVLMADFADGLRHPDGQIPLFADAAFGIAPAPADLLGAAEVLLDVPGRWRDARPGRCCALLAPTFSGIKRCTNATQPAANVWPATGYLKFAGRTSGDAMIVDTQPLGPPHLPAHGHCSLFSYELSLNGQRVVVDSGVEEYQPGPWRDFWRSTRAHNTVTVDGKEQSEIWGSFRVGQRVRVVESKLERSDNGAVFLGAHGGFAGQQPPTPHRRLIAALPGGIWVVFDEIGGKGSHAIESFVHLVPGAECAIYDSHTSVILGDIQLGFYPYRSAEVESAEMSLVRSSTKPVQGWYAPEFGKREPNTVLSFLLNARSPARLGYLIAPLASAVVSWDINVNTSVQKTVVDIKIRQPHAVREYCFSMAP